MLLYGIFAPFCVLADDDIMPVVLPEDAPDPIESASGASFGGDLGAEPGATPLPGDYVTRARAVDVLIDGIGDELKAVMPADLTVFSDYESLSPEDVYSMGLAVALGAVNGSDDGLLHPEDYVTRVECFAIVSRILAREDLPTDLGEDSSSFSDVPDWAVQDIERLKNAGLVVGYNDGTLGAYDFMLYEDLLLVHERMIGFHNGTAGDELYKNDFYQYVNEQWLGETTLPEGYAKWSNAEQLAQNNAYRIQSIIGEIITDYYVGNVPAKGTNEQKIIDIYLAAANEKYRETVGIEPIKPYLKLIDDMEKIDDLPYVLAELEKAGFHSLIPIKINSDFSDSSKNRISFEACYTGIEPGVIKSGDYEKVESAYRTYIGDLFAAIGQQPREAANNAAKAAEICIRLGKATMDDSLWDRPELIYNLCSEKEIKELFSNIKISEYIEDLGYNSADNIIVFDKELAKAINGELKSWNLDNLKQYLKAALLDCSALYLNSAMFDAHRNYIDEISGTESAISSSAYAVTITQSLLGMELGEKYIERYFSADSKKEIEDLANLIIKTFEKRIDNLEWMNLSTKEVAKDKLESISVQIGYPDYIRGYVNEDFNVRSTDEGGNLMEYVIDYNKMTDEKNREVINGDLKTDKTAWSLTPQSVNAYYDRVGNCIVIPAGMLQAPYYSPNASFETNLGGIGSVIAHEITHAFDNVGSQFDKNGNYRDWWLKEDYSSFSEICRKFVGEYEKIEVLPGAFVDGDLTLSENIADIGAMACILDIAGKNAPNLDELFKTYARTYREVCTDEYGKILLSTDVHSPNRVRVNMVLSNFEEFLNLYNITPGCGMYRSKNSRLKIW